MYFMLRYTCINQGWKQILAVWGRDRYIIRDEEDAKRVPFRLCVCVCFPKITTLTNILLSCLFVFKCKNVWTCAFVHAANC